MSAEIPQRTVKARLREVRATLIMDVAEEVLIEKGYHDTSIDEIAARAGIAKGTLYQHFPGKEDLVVALFERGLGLFELSVEQAAASDLPARAKLEQILHYVYQELRGTRALLRLLSHNAEIRNGLDKKRTQIHTRLGRSMERLRVIIEEGKREGAFDPTISTGLMLNAFMSSLMFKRLERLIGEEQLSTEETIAQVGRLLFDGFSIKQ